MFAKQLNQLFLLVCLCLLIAVQPSSQAKPKSKSGSNNNVTCDRANLAKADLCGEKLFFVGKNARNFPTNEGDLEKYCSQTTSLVQCVKRFTDKCSVNDVQRQLANVMLYTARSHNKNICGSKVKRANLLTMSKCANSIKKESTRCMDKMLAEFGQALQLREQKYRIPYACCSFNQMRTCIMASVDRADKQICNEKARENFDQYIGTMAGNTMELMCAEYDSESDKCNKVKKLSFDASKAQPSSSLLRAFGDLLLSDKS